MNAGSVRHPIGRFNVGTSANAPIVFLAMFWGGGGPFRVSEILHVCDWLNRVIYGRQDLEDALNDLLAMRLIELEAGRFGIPGGALREFAEFHRKRRRDRFETVQLYFRDKSAPEGGARRFMLTEAEYSGHLAEYRRDFARALGHDA